MKKFVGPPVTEILKDSNAAPIVHSIKANHGCGSYQKFLAHNIFRLKNFQALQQFFV